METSCLSQEDLILLGIRQLLSQVYPQFLQCRCPFESPYPKGSTLVMDSPPTTRVRIFEDNVLFGPSSFDPRHRLTLLHHDGRFPSCGRSSPTSRRYQH
jgi:hypothetical protein